MIVDFPAGPAESLFGDEYYMLISKALRHGGIVCSQGENPWFHADIIDKLISGCKKIFPVVDYAYTCIPTYPGGQIGFLLCSNSPVSISTLSVSVLILKMLSHKKAIMPPNPRFL